MLQSTWGLDPAFPDFLLGSTDTRDAKMLQLEVEITESRMATAQLELNLARLKMEKLMDEHAEQMRKAPARARLLRTREGAENRGDGDEENDGDGKDEAPAGPEDAYLAQGISISEERNQAEPLDVEELGDVESSAQYGHRMELGNSEDKEQASHKRAKNDEYLTCLEEFCQYDLAAEIQRDVLRSVWFSIFS